MTLAYIDRHVATCIWIRVHGRNCCLKWKPTIGWLVAAHLPYPNKIHYLLTNQNRTKRQTQSELVFTFKKILFALRLAVGYIHLFGFIRHRWYSKKISLLRTFFTLTIYNAYVQHAQVLRIHLTRERLAAETSGDGAKVKIKYWCLVYPVPAAGDSTRLQWPPHHHRHPYHKIDTHSIITLCQQKCITIYLSRRASMLTPERARRHMRRKRKKTKRQLNQFNRSCV